MRCEAEGEGYEQQEKDGKKILIACIGIFLVGVGIAFNAMAGLGNDPVGIFYDGIRNAMGLNENQLGMASNFVNILLMALLFFTGRRYLNMGTLIYIIPYGACVSAGTSLYKMIFPVQQTLGFQILASTAGCILLYTGVAFFVAMDIGMDPMTGMAMVLRDKLHCEFKIAKWIFDGTMTLLGIVTGGKLGVITVITAVCAGPAIQMIAEKVTDLAGDSVKAERKD